MKIRKSPLAIAAAVAISLSVSGASTSAMEPAKTTQFWWPDAINLSPLRQHSPVSNPYGTDFDYAEEFLKLDLQALKDEIAVLLTDSQDW